MASIPPPTGAAVAAQLSLQQLRLQQAQRTAEQAEQIARSLAAQARAAEQDAFQAQENARALGVQSDRAQVTAGQARQGVAAIQTAGQMKLNVSNTLTQVTQKLEASPSAAANEKSVAPVVNTQGQLTGTQINTTA